MIRHEILLTGALGLGLAQVVGALAVAVIEAAFLRLLMPAVGGAPLLAEGRHPAGIAAIGLITVTRRADEEDPPTLRGAAKALPKKQLIFGQHRAAKRG